MERWHLSTPCQKFTEVLPPVESRAKAGTWDITNFLKGLIFSLLTRLFAFASAEFTKEHLGNL
jgi:hypothetical protein